jgi:hypothetical protein
MNCETYTLAPSIVVDKGRKLYSAGLYAQALEVLRRNCVEARVYPTWVEMSVPRQIKKVGGQFQKGHSVRRGTKTENKAA